MRQINGSRLPISAGRFGVSTKLGFEKSFQSRIPKMHLEA
jgi:hypothetical protein